MHWPLGESNQERLYESLVVWSNSLLTSANWIFNFMVVMVTPVAFDSIKYKTYIIFAVM